MTTMHIKNVKDLRTGYSHPVRDDKGRFISRRESSMVAYYRGKRGFLTDEKPNVVEILNAKLWLRLQNIITSSRNRVR